MSQRKEYSKEFKIDAVNLVKEQGDVVKPIIKKYIPAIHSPIKGSSIPPKKTNIAMQA